VSGTAPAGAPPGTPNMPPPVQLRRRRFSFVWLIPLIAALIAIYLGYRTFKEQGPLLTLTFDSADGLSAGQTQVKYKAVALGTVESIDLSPDNSHVVVKVRMNSVGARFLTNKARYWVVRANFSLSDPSSLGSFVSGAYIAVDPGGAGGRYCDNFTGLEEPPGVRSDEPGRTYRLMTEKVGSLRTGSPVFYRDAIVGEVLGYDLGNGLVPVTVNIFVRAPFDALVRAQSHFWNASGISLDTEPGAFHVEFESLEAVVAGGVAFNLPQQAADEPPSPNNTAFALYASRTQAESAGYDQSIPAVAYFHSSVAGLAAGSPVDIYGLQVGVVTDVQLILNPNTGEEKVRVAMALQPQRNAHGADFMTDAQTAALLQKIINRGTRVELDTASLVTGQKIITIATVPGAGPAQITREGDAYVLPSQSGGLDSTVASLSDISAKLDKIPFDKIANNLNTLLETTNGTLGSKDTKQAIASLAVTLRTMNTTLSMFNENYGDDSDFQRNLEQVMAQGSDTLRSIKQLSDYLDRHPDALLLGRGGGQ
jgi:paraquat-inducible protein B